jgi:hypothetical protein
MSTAREGPELTMSFMIWTREHGRWEKRERDSCWDAPGKARDPQQSEPRLIHFQPFTSTTNPHFDFLCSRLPPPTSLPSSSFSDAGQDGLPPHPAITTSLHQRSRAVYDQSEPPLASRHHNHHTSHAPSLSMHPRCILSSSNKPCQVPPTPGPRRIKPAAAHLLMTPKPTRRKRWVSYFLLLFPHTLSSRAPPS